MVTRFLSRSFALCMSCPSLSTRSVRHRQIEGAWGQVVPSRPSTFVCLCKPLNVHHYVLPRRKCEHSWRCLYPFLNCPLWTCSCVFGDLHHHFCALLKMSGYYCFVHKCDMLYKWHHACVYWCFLIQCFSGSEKKLSVHAWTCGKRGTCHLHTINIKWFLQSRLNY